MINRTGTLSPVSNLLWEATRLEADLDAFKAEITKQEHGWGYRIQRNLAFGGETVLQGGAETLQECMKAVESWGRASEDLGSTVEVTGQDPGRSP